MLHVSPDLCFAASRSRDPRFDGRFFIAVKTTGIYCRPVCPARAPLRQNVVYYASAAAAEAAGFRPCKRCRPETSPGTPAWSGTSATVSRALRMIEENLTLDDLPKRLGVTGRHLRRLFDEHLGASPMAILQTQRLHLARTLLHDTVLSITDVAFAAGFDSVRRFNDAIRKTYHCTPTQLRSGGQPPSAVQVTLAYRTPFRFESMAKFLAERNQMPDVPLEFNGHLRMTVPADRTRDIHELVQRARRTFDLTADPNAIDDHLKSDKVLRPLLRKRPGPRVPGAWNPFEVAIRAIVGQQISVQAATTIMSRGDLTTGMPQSRIDTIKRFTEAFENDPTLLTRGATLEESIERLTAIKGIGPWTANYIAMRTLGEPDAFPHSDLGLLKASGMSPKQLLEHAERWRPFRAYAAIALWESL